MGPFQLFSTTSYTFLKLQSGMGGNKVLQEYQADGIFKLRSGMLQADNAETFESAATLHIKPTEAYITAVGAELVGNGVRVTKDGHSADYRITGQTEGYDYDKGELAFYRLTLQRESLWDVSELPIE